jgi:DeoR/GlpR family transcriptional regulator of sugar metabolism
MMGKNDRESKLLDTLKVRQKLNNDEVMEMFGISESSARRLFADLERSGKVVRTHGGIHLVSVKEAFYSFEDLESRNLPQKQQIAGFASTMIRDNDIVYFDSGTTIFQLAIAIKKKLQNKELQGIRVITNSFANLQALNDSCNVILIGGEFRPKRKDFAGYAAERFVQNFNYSKAFLGSDGFDLAEGFMATDTNTAKLNEIIIKRSEQSFFLLDSSKVGVRSFVSFAGLTEVRTLITDGGIDSAILAQCRKANVNVQVAQN